MADDHQDAMLYRRIFLPADFRRVKNSREPFWSDTVQLERLSRSNHAVLSIWNKLEVLNLKTGAMQNSFVPLPLWWSRFEVSKSFWDQMSTPMEYIGS